MAFSTDCVSEGYHLPVVAYGRQRHIKVSGPGKEHEYSWLRPQDRQHYDSSTIPELVCSAEVAFSSFGSTTLLRLAAYAAQVLLIIGPDSNCIGYHLPSSARFRS